MEITSELKEKIEEIFCDDEDLKKRLLALDPDAIKSLALTSHKMDPKKVIENYESGNTEAIYAEAVKKVNVMDIYHQLCTIYEHNCAEEARIKKLEKESNTR